MNKDLEKLPKDVPLGALDAVAHVRWEIVPGPEGEPDQVVGRITLDLEAEVRMSVDLFAEMKDQPDLHDGMCETVRDALARDLGEIAAANLPKKKRRRGGKSG